MQAVHLELVNLRDNSIELLDEWSRSQIDKLYYNKIHGSILPTHQNQRLVIDLRDNPFSCQCPSKDFISCFVNSPVFDKTMKDYHCSVDGYEIPVNRKAINVIEDICDKKKTITVCFSSNNISCVIRDSIFQAAKIIQKTKDQSENEPSNRATAGRQA